MHVEKSPNPAPRSLPELTSILPELPATEAQAREPWRFWFIALGFGLLSLLVLLRIVTYERTLNLPWEVNISTQNSARGSVVDRYGELMAFDRYYSEISATPSHLDAEERRDVANRLEALLGIDNVQTYQLLTESADREYTLIAKDLSLEAGHRLLDYKEEVGDLDPFTNLHVSFAPKRFYPQREVACHVVGLVGYNDGENAQRRGFYGTEGYYDGFLLKQSPSIGRRSLDIDVALSADERRYLPSPIARDIVLTIDRSMQWIAESELQRSLKKYKAESGSIVVMDPNTGEVLAMASWPVFDPNNYGDADPEAFRNPVVSEQYEPGSIFKIITMAAGLDTGVIEPSTPFTDTGVVTLGQRIFFNSNRLAYGNVTTSEALARSLNVVTVQVAERIGKDDFYQYLRRFGFGDATDVDLSGEIAGAIKLPNNPNWSVSDLGTNSFGQGIAVTPLQMLNATAAIANGGNLMRPYVVHARVEGDQVNLTEPMVVRAAISPETAAKMTAMMVEVVETGALGARVEGYTIAGKTGTAQIPTERGYTDDETIVSFVGFAPADDPQFVALVKLVRPDPEISPWATYTAAPAFAELAKKLFEHMNIPPDAIRLGKVANNSQ